MTLRVRWVPVPQPVGQEVRPDGRPVRDELEADVRQHAAPVGEMATSGQSEPPAGLRRRRERI